MAIQCLSVNNLSFWTTFRFSLSPLSRKVQLCICVLCVIKKRKHKSFERNKKTCTTSTKKRAHLMDIQLNFAVDYKSFVGLCFIVVICYCILQLLFMHLFFIHINRTIVYKCALINQNVNTVSIGSVFIIHIFTCDCMPFTDIN